MSRCPGERLQDLKDVGGEMRAFIASISKTADAELARALVSRWDRAVHAMRHVVGLYFREVNELRDVAEKAMDEAASVGADLLREQSATAALRTELAELAERVDDLEHEATRLKRDRDEWQERAWRADRLVESLLREVMPR